MFRITERTIISLLYVASAYQRTYQSHTNRMQFSDIQTRKEVAQAAIEE